MNEIKFMVFDARTDEIVNGHFMLTCDGVLYKTFLGIAFKIKEPDKYTVRMIADEVD